jgi:hypothetical protein
MAVDVSAEKLYWAESRGIVRYITYDKGEGSVLLTLGDANGAGATGIDLDLAAHKMYLAVPSRHSIMRANLDGTGLETVLSLPASEMPYGMAVFDDRIYWADRSGGSIRSASSDGSDLRTLVSGLSSPGYISVMAPEPATASILLGIALLISRNSRRRV